MLTAVLLMFPGCKVESISLNIEAVNTHRDRPEVKTRLAHLNFTHALTKLDLKPDYLSFIFVGLGDEEKSRHSD